MSDGKHWKEIPGWPEYERSTSGDIRRISPSCGATLGKILKWMVMKSGYAKVSLCRNSQRSEFLVHRLVVMTFIGDIPRKMDVCHFDGNKLNNSVGNLRIDTRKGNMADQIRMGKTPRGQKCGSNVHPPETILKIREIGESGKGPSEIGRMLDLSPEYVGAVLARKIWSWL